MTDRQNVLLNAFLPDLSACLSQTSAAASKLKVEYLGGRLRTVRQTVRQTERQTERQTVTQTDKKKYLI